MISVEEFKLKRFGDKPVNAAVLSRAYEANKKMRPKYYKLDKLVKQGPTIGIRASKDRTYTQNHHKRNSLLYECVWSDEEEIKLFGNTKAHYSKVEQEIEEFLKTNFKKSS